jgi:hypothetical protein
MFRMNQETTQMTFDQIINMLQTMLQNLSLNERILENTNQVLDRVFTTNEVNRVAIAKLDTNIYHILENIFDRIQISSNTITNLDQNIYSQILVIKRFLKFFKAKFDFEQDSLRKFSTDQQVHLFEIFSQTRIIVENQSSSLQQISQLILSTDNTAIIFETRQLVLTQISDTESNIISTINSFKFEEKHQNTFDNLLKISIDLNQLRIENQNNEQSLEQFILKSIDDLVKFLPKILQ